MSYLMKPVILVSSLFAAQIVFAPAFAFPRGSYTESCIGIQESRYPNGSGGYTDRLSAQCRDRQGRVVNAYLDNYRACQRGTITNDDGRLICQYQ